MQDSDADSESDAFAYLFDSIRSPMKRQSSRRTESSLENDSSWTNCFQSITHLSSNVQSLFRIPVYRYLLFGNFHSLHSDFLISSSQPSPLCILLSLESNFGEQVIC
jgi:hypothetical protein